VLLVLSCPLVQADDGSVNVTLKVNIVSPLSVVTCGAWGIGTKQAILYGRLTSLGTASLVDVSFGWDNESHAEDAGAYENWTRPEVKTHRGFFWAFLHGLTPDTTYYFRAKAEDDVTSYGEELSFTTKPRWHWWWGWWEWLCRW
jgi:hypothetical protein